MTHAACVTGGLLIVGWLLAFRGCGGEGGDLFSAYL
jgi:hypothetical protein